MQEKEIKSPELRGEETKGPAQKTERAETVKVPNNTDWFDLVYNSVLGFLAAIAVAVVFLFMIAGLGYWCYEGYCRWFSTKNMTAVGNNGYFYDSENDCFIKPKPNRRVLKGCEGLEYSASDSIGVVRVGTNTYRYVNLNTLTFLNDVEYYRADLFKGKYAMALADDTLYSISTKGEIINKEYADWVYTMVEEISYMVEEMDSDGDIYYQEIPTGVFMYRDVNFNYGLMSSDFTRLTQPLFSSITARSKDVFFCEYMDSEMGVLIDRNGKILK